MIDRERLLELEERATAESDPTRAAALYLELARELGELHPEAAADHAARALELCADDERDDGEQARHAAEEAAFYAGLTTTRRHRRALEELDEAYLAQGETRPALRALHSVARRLSRRLADAGARGAASRAAELAWRSEHRLASLDGGLLKRIAYAFWRLTAGYGERPLRLVVSSLVIIYVFGLLFIAVNYLGAVGGGPPSIINFNLFDLFGYFGVSLAAFFGGGFSYAGDALGWVLISLEAVLGWLATLTLITVLIRRLLR